MSLFHENIFKKHKINRDGNCLFRSISLKIYGHQESHLLLRDLATKYIHENWHSFKDFLLTSRDEYTDSISQTGVYGTSIECLALSEVLSKDIVIYYLQKPDIHDTLVLNSQPIIFSKTSHTDIIHLLLSGNFDDGHFELLTPSASLTKHHKEGEQLKPNPHQKFPCQDCSQCFSSIRGLKKHRSMKHRENLTFRNDTSFVDSSQASQQLNTIDNISQATECNRSMDFKSSEQRYDFSCKCTSPRRTERILRSSSASSFSPIGSRPVNSAPATAEQVTLLMLSVQKMGSDIAAIKSGQQDIYAGLKQINSTLSEHSEIMNKHALSISKCENNLLEQSATISACQSSISQLQSSYSEVSSHIKLLESRLQSLHFPATVPPRDDSSRALASPSADTLDKLKRAHNIIIAALPEVSGDTDQIKILVDTVIPNSSQTILSTYRIGSNKNCSDRPRLVKVTFNNIITPKVILRNKFKLASSDFVGVSLRDDKCLEELRLLSSLREQLKTRKSAGEKDITIKYVKGIPVIVHQPPKN